MTATRPDQRCFLSICLLLALGTAVLYWPVTGYPFVMLDDGLYVTENPHVTAGLNGANLIWAFQSTEAANWHPLTWLSHMLDCQLFGLKAGWHHFVNLLFHIANTLLLFIFLQNTTRALWRSAIVAALFAWHPLHVESVAWVAERKDVLSTCFWLLTLLAYTRYTQARPDNISANSTSKSPGPKFFYGLALLGTAAALMSKPMAVTLPFTLLLVDLWPLNRIQNTPDKIRLAARLVLEKIPFFVLAIASSIVTYHAQAGSGSVGGFSWSGNVANAFLSYIRYLAKFFWPADLAVLYPLPSHWPMLLTIGALVPLAAWTFLCLHQWRKRPCLAMGWLWFLGTLVPVIGFVQVGMQSMADRYTYVPSIGFFIVVVWGIGELARLRPTLEKFLPAGAALILAGCLVVTSLQITCWQNSVRLFLHAVDSTTDNYVAFDYLGCALVKVGRRDDAIKCFEESIRIVPYHSKSRANLALARLENNQPDEAFQQYAALIDLNPDDAVLRYQVSLYLLQYGRVESAKKELTDALRLQPDFCGAQVLLGAIYLQQTNLAEAIPLFTSALKINPRHAEAHFKLGLAWQQQGKIAEAAGQFREAVRLNPDDDGFKATLEQFLAAHPETIGQTGTNAVPHE